MLQNENNLGSIDKALIMDVFLQRKSDDFLVNKKTQSLDCQPDNQAIFLLKK
jgi:hypothetical protein